jgi:monofunctional biosynthetic peptidoglycan transglycosylase
MRVVWRWVKKVILGVLLVIFIFLLYQVVTFPRVSKLKSENPESTALMDARVSEAREKGQELRRSQTWVPLDKISVNLQRAVIAGEDANFAEHRGFDYDAIQKAWDQARKDADREAKDDGDSEDDWIPPMPSFKRGASTISQQLAKNLYLSSDRTFFRKIKEAVITYFLERDLSKRRILELYLNVIEWGDGIYGAEAASQFYFKKPASALSAAEAAYLSAIIPNPRTIFNPRTHPRRVARRQRIILRGLPYAKLPR